MLSLTSANHGTSAATQKRDIDVVDRRLERMPIIYDQQARSISLFYRVFLSFKCFYLNGKCSRRALGDVVE